MPSDELTKLIDSLVEQKTFGLDALGPIKDLRDRAAKQEALLRTSADEIRELKTQGYQKDGQIARLANEVKDWTQRLAEIENRERKIFELEKASAVAVAQSDIWSNAFHSIFKNTVVRETINRDIPLTRNYGGTGGDYVERHQARTVVDRDTE